ncbi:hypothetical protein G3M58_18990 [Streptomyces sp. SID7499]|uniref:Uncharacterized protein n=1 Tax=Streptomyces sp. SID7499 TaxID=2706086 RepID=A0A6G3WSP1_9ACTN|nr:hypothetical protein [Streptomyces sp. SID7499]
MSYVLRPIPLVLTLLADAVGLPLVGRRAGRSRPSSPGSKLSAARGGRG